MEIQKILNNNAVVVGSANEEESILLGNGLGFRKKIGGTIDPTKIEKIYHLKGTSSSTAYPLPCLALPEEVMTLSATILANARRSLAKELDDSALLVIADHLQTAITRAKENIPTNSFLLGDMVRYFPLEFEFSKESLRLIEQHVKVALPEDEAAFLTLHLVNADTQTTHQTCIHVRELMEEILALIKESLPNTIYEESPAFQRLLTHLRFLAERILTANPSSSTSMLEQCELLELVTKKYPTAFALTQKIKEHLHTRCHYPLSNDEQIYITIHLAHLLEKPQQ